MTNIDALITKCQEERNLFHNIQERKSPCCAELFRWGFVRNQRAFSGIKEIFEPEMRRWLGRQSQLTTQDIEDVLQDAWLAFWKNAPKRELALNDELGPVVTYLHLCTKTRLLMWLRKNKHRITLELPEDGKPSLVSEDPMNRTDIRLILEQRLRILLKTDVEQLVFHLRLVVGMSPQQIFETHPELFRDKREIYNTIDRILNHLRSDPVLQELHLSHGKPGRDASLKISMFSEEENSTVQKGNINVSEPCKLSEAVLFDYLTGIASAEGKVAIEYSPVCLEAAKRLGNDLLPLLPYMERITCPDVGTLVAYKEGSLTDPERLNVQHHVSYCPLCTEELQMLESFAPQSNHTATSLFDKIPTLEQIGEIVNRIITRILPRLIQLQGVRSSTTPNEYECETAYVYIHLMTREIVDKRRTWRLSVHLHPHASEPAIALSEEMLTLARLGESTQSPYQSRAIGVDKFVFDRLAAGRYMLTISMPEEEIVIPEILIGEKHNDSA